MCVGSFKKQKNAQVDFPELRTFSCESQTLYTDPRYTASYLLPFLRDPGDTDAWGK